MIQEIPGNTKNKFKNNKEGLICGHCTSGEIMTQSHCMSCPAWTDLRIGLNLNEIKDMTTFFQKLLVKRAKMEVEKVWPLSRLHCTTPDLLGELVEGAPKYVCLYLVNYAI